MEDILGLVALSFIDVFLVGTGRIIVRLGSLGRWRGEKPGGKESRTHAVAGSLSFLLEGRRVFTRTGLLLVGVAFYLSLIVGLVFISGLQRVA